MTFPTSASGSITAKPSCSALGLAPATQVNIVDHEAQHHIHRKANQGWPRHRPHRQAVSRRDRRGTSPATAILIAGPGRAKTDLQSYLKEHAPKISEHVWGIEPMDHPGSGGLVVAAHKYFFAADRMHV